MYLKQHKMRYEKGEKDLHHKINSENIHQNH